MRMLVLIAAFLAAAGSSAQDAPQQAAPAATSQQASSDEDFTKAAFFGKKFFELHEYGSAYEQFAKADELRPDQPAILYDMALVLAKAGRYSEAQVKVDRYNQLYPEGAEKAFVSKLQLELEFQRELQKKRQADEDYTEMFSRGKFLYAKNDLGAALQVFEQAEQQRPRDPAAVFNEAVIYEKQGDLAKAAERFRRYQELEADPAAKAETDQRIFALDNELQDMKTKLVCSFCGLKLPAGATWCPRCWHGPYSGSASWNSRPCVENATATRSTYYSDNRLQKNEPLPCLAPNGTIRESLSYTPARQRAIEEARKAEGWSFDGDIIQGWSDSQGNQIRYVQGPERLEKIVSPSTGEVLQFDAHRAAADGPWLLDREDVVIDGQKYTSRYTFDAGNRIAQQQVTYQNAAACNHIVTMIADYVYQNDALVAVAIKGGYEGYPAEGSPQTNWTASIAYTFDNAARVAKEELALTSFTKTYTQKPQGALRDEVNKLYTGMRIRKPIESVMRFGDYCATSGSTLIANPIDLRPFYPISPNLDIVLPLGVVRASVTFTYPDSYKVR